jgi:hypothetical protein
MLNESDEDTEVLDTQVNEDEEFDKPEDEFNF